MPPLPLPTSPAGAEGEPDLPQMLRDFELLSGVRGVLLDGEGRILAVGVEPHPCGQPGSTCRAAGDTCHAEAGSLRVPVGGLGVLCSGPFRVAGEASPEAGPGLPALLTPVQAERLQGLLTRLGGILSARERTLRACRRMVASEERLRQLFETALHGIVIQDAHGAIEAANPAAERILGLSLDQLQGRTSMDPRWRTLHEDGSPFPGETHPAMVALATGRPVEGVVMGIHRPGAEAPTWIEITAVPLFREGEATPHQVHATFVDITARRAAVQAQHLSEARLEQAFEASPIGMALLSPQGRFLRVNGRFAAMLGRDAAELLDKGFRDITHPEDLASSAAAVGDLLAGRTQAFQLEKRYLRADGREFWGEVHVTAVRDAEGRPLNLLAQIQDIDARKAAERQRAMTLGVLDLLNRVEEPEEALPEILEVIHQGTGMAAVAIRLAAEEDFTYAAHRGFPEAFIQAENCLRARSRAGEPLFDAEGRPLFECTCGLVLTGRTDPSNPLFTPGGSAWTNDALPLLEVPPEDDPRFHPRNRCIHAGYRSVALVPIRSGSTIVGLLQLNDARPGRLTADLVTFLEGLTASLALALARRRDRQQRAATEKRLATLFLAVPDPVYLLDPSDRTILDANRGFETLSGYTREEILGRTTVALGLIQDPQRSEQVWRRLRKEGQVRDEALACRDRHGRAFWVDLHVSPVELEERTALLVVVRDITARRQAEEALREHQAMLQAILDTIPQAVFWKDTEGRYLGCNRAFARAAGREDPRDLAGLTDFDLPWPRAEAEAYRADDREVLRSGQPKSHIQEPLQQADGTRLWIDTTKVPLRDGQGTIIGVLGVYEDVTASRRAQELLALAETRYRTFVSHATEGIYRIDFVPPVPVDLPEPELLARLTGQAVIGEVNEALASMYGLQAADILGRPATDFAPEYGKRALAALRAPRGQVRDLETRDVDGEGREILLLENFTASVEEGRLVHIWGMQRDVTEQRRAEAALRESEEKFAVAFRSAPVLASLSDAETGRLLDVNEAFESASGWSREEAIGRTTLELGWLTSEERSRMLACVEREGRLRDFEAHLCDRQGREVVGLATGTFVTLGGRRLLLTTALDITQRRQAEEEARRRAEELDIFFRSNLDLLCVADTGGRFVRLNPEWERTLGYPMRELEGAAFLDYVHPEDREATLAAVARLADQREVIGFSNRYRCQDGSYRWLEWYAVPHGTAIYASARDVTEWMRSEEALRESEERWGFALEGSGDGVWDWDVPSGRVFFSRRWKLMLGYGEHEIGSGLEEWSDRVHPEDRDRVLAEVQRHLDGLAQHYASEHRVRCKDGTWKWILDRGLVVSRDPEGRPLRVIGTHSDISERKRAEERERTLNLQLHHAQKMDSLGSLAGGVAHDLNNVLGAILSLSTTLRTRFLPPDPTASALDTITKACMRGRDVVRSLLVFSRRELEEERPVDLNALVHEVVQLLSHTTLKRVELVVELSEPAPVVLGDAGALNHALINLCVNAVDAMPEGGTLTLAAGRSGTGGTFLRVGDTGRGMSPEVLQRATEPFFTTKPQGQGTGLGLSMVYGTLQAHGGHLSLQSQEGKGTEITLVFPASRSVQVAPAEPPQPAPLAALRSRRVLLVDDEELIRMATASLLERLGHRVHAAPGGREALDLLESGLQVDLVILDMNMPGLSGAATLPLILALRPHQPVLIATGYADARADALLRAHPTVRLVTKPFSLDELQRAIAGLCGGPP